MQPSCNIPWLAVLLSSLPITSSHSTAMIQAQGREGYFRLRSPLTQITTSSARLCAQSCWARDGCLGAMYLAGDVCVLYGERTCPCVDVTVSLSPDWPTRYQLGFSAQPLGMQDASRICEKQGMSLLSVTDQQEQDLIAQFINSKRKSRKYLATLHRSNNKLTAKPYG